MKPETKARGTQAIAGRHVNAALKKRPWGFYGTYTHTNKRVMRVLARLGQQHSRPASVADCTRLGEACRKAERKPDACCQNNAKTFPSYFTKLYIAGDLQFTGLHSHSGSLDPVFLQQLFSSGT